ncbi:MAG: MFS transporter [Maricaulaceae bacterium]|jgi:benzoate transport
MSQDPRQLIARAPMSGFQIVVVALCVGLNALDGFDVLAISFASPGIAAEWGVSQAALGFVLSMELIGMGLGSVLIGGLADRVGRRPIILACIVVMAIGMFLTSRASDVVTLSAFRVFTGIGIGGMLASVTAMVAEYSNVRRRSLSVTLMGAGYPLGIVIGGSIASVLLANFDWRAVFLFGSIATIAFLPLAFFLLPESIEHLYQRRPARALERINATMRRMGHATVEALGEVASSPAKIPVVQLFSGGLARTTILLSIAYFTHIMTFYFILKWVPKLVVDMGFAPSAAGGVLTWANVGSVIGAVLIGLLALRFGVRWLTIGALLFASGMVVVFGQGQADLTELSTVAAGVGFFTNSAIVGIYAIFAHAYPTEARAGGTGFVIGVGRGGAALGPVIAGFLFEAGQPLPIVAVFMATGSAIAAVALLFLRFTEADKLPEAAADAVAAEAPVKPAA